MKWEHKVVDLTATKRSFWTGKAAPNGLESKLNDLLSQGWELASGHLPKRGGAIFNAAEHLTIFKRRKT